MSDQPRWLVYLLIGLGIAIVIISYAVNFFNNPPKYYRQYKTMINASQITKNFDDSTFNMMNNASIVISEDNQVSLECQQNKALIYCNDGFNEIYLSDTEKYKKNNYILTKNIYNRTWQTKNLYKFFGYYPNILMFGETLSAVVNATNNNYIKESDLYNIIYDVYGTKDKIKTNQNKYEVILDLTSSSINLTIKPDVNNFNSEFTSNVSIEIVANKEDININKNTFR